MSGASTKDLNALTTAISSQVVADRVDDPGMEQLFPIRNWWHSITELFRPKSYSDSISFLLSLCTHVAILLLLAFITFGAGRAPRSLLMSFSDGNAPSETTTLDFDPYGTDEKDILTETMDESAELQAVSLESIREINDTIQDNSLEPNARDSEATESIVSSLVPSNVPTAEVHKTNAINASHSKLFMGSSLEGRSPENRRKMAMANGGNAESEQAVDDALVWLANHQAYDGSWSMEMTDHPCNGKCSHGTVETGSDKRISATGLALLCFLGAGHTHKKGEYHDHVDKGLAYLSKSLHDGRFLKDDFQYEMYEHGIAALALSEACEMTGDTSLLPHVRSAIGFMVRAQHPNGSWGYTPRITGDLSIVGWQMMALKSANRIGVRVSPEVIEQVDRFLDSQSSEYGSFYGYRSNMRDPCMTSIGLLLRLYRGWPKSAPRILKGADYIADLGPSTNAIYYNYYATQLLFHLRHAEWNQWNQSNRDFLVAQQSKEGHSKGSWYIGKSHFNQVGGRLYCTAMATLSLEVYYRFMPIYHEIKEDDFAL